MISKKNLLAAFALVLSHSPNLVAQSTITSQLNYRPPSTSYQPYSKGEIVRSSLGGQTLAQKFEQAGQSLYGAGWISFQNIFASRYRSNAKGFEGFCHQWAAGAQDIQLNQMIDRTGGISCGNTTLSVPELRELVTALYLNEGRREDFGTQPHRTPQIRLIRNEMGMDRISALTFHNEIHNSLRQGEGVVLDIGPEGEIWNYPTYRIDSNFQQINVQSHSGSPLPPAAFLEHARQEYQLFFDALNRYASRTDEISDMEMSVTQSYIDHTKSLYRKLLNAVDPSVKVYRVKSIVHHAGVSDFASGDQVSKTKEFEYILVGRGNGNNIQFIDGIWISKISKEPGLSHWLNDQDGRPSRIWFPKPQSLVPTEVLAADPHYPQRPAFQALVTMIQRCQPLRR